MTVKLRQLYKVNDETVQLVLVHYQKQPRIRKGITEYIFRNKTGKTICVKDTNRIQEIAR